MRQKKSIASRAIEILSLPTYWVVTLWVVHLGKLLLHWDLYDYGLVPRTMSGLKGIFTAPMIHSNINHLFSNSVPLFVLSSLIILFYRRVAYRSILLIYILTGIVVWLMGRGYTSHIGASGVVYGLVTFVFWSGIFRRNVKSIILAMVVTILYSGYFFGVLPNQVGISWESHLFGALVGVLVAYWMKNELEVDEVKKAKPWPTVEQSHFLPRDAFEKTKAQRAYEEQLRRMQDEDDWTIDMT